MAHNPRNCLEFRVRILHDPLPFYEGGFRPGASITLEELKCGLENRTFVLGTVFRINGKNEVLKRINGKYRLVMEA